MTVLSHTPSQAVGRPQPRGRTWSRHTHGAAATPSQGPTRKRRLQRNLTPGVRRENHARIAGMRRHGLPAVSSTAGMAATTTLIQ